MVLSNSPKIALLDKGPLTKRERRTAKPAAVSYFDIHGRKCVRGDKTLKCSQLPA